MIRFLRYLIQRSRFRQMREQLARLPAQPEQFDQLFQWSQFLIRWRPHFQFNVYTAALGEVTYFDSRYNNVEEFFSTLRVLIQAIRQERTVVLPDIEFQLSREPNVDYFLTSRKGMSLSIKEVFDRTVEQVQVLCELGVELQTKLELEPHHFQHYQLKSRPVLHDVIEIVVKLITLCDLYQLSSEEKQ